MARKKKEDLEKWTVSLFIEDYLKKPFICIAEDLGKRPAHLIVELIIDFISDEAILEKVRLARAKRKVMESAKNAKDLESFGTDVMEKLFERAKTDPDMKDINEKWKNEVSGGEGPDPEEAYYQLMAEYGLADEGTKKYLQRKKEIRSELTPMWREPSKKKKKQKKE